MGVSGRIRCRRIPGDHGIRGQDPPALQPVFYGVFPNVNYAFCRIDLEGLLICDLET